jgi:hypothetical protein
MVALLPVGLFAMIATEIINRKRSESIFSACIQMEKCVLFLQPPPLFERNHAAFKSVV